MTAPWDQRSPDEQTRVQGLVLDQWLPSAIAFTATWADLARDRGIGRGASQTRPELAAFPPVRELDLLRASGTGAPGLLMRPTEDQVKAHAAGGTLRAIARSIRRSGPDGKRLALLTEYKPIHVHRGGVDDDLAIAYSRSDLDRLHRAGARAAAVLGLDDTDYLVSAVPAGPTLAWWGVYHLALGASMLALHPRGAGDDLERCLASFGLLPVTAVAVATDEAEALAGVIAGADGVDAVRVDTVVLVGPPPSDEDRGRIAEAWQAAGASRDLRVRALWAPSEARALWAECAEGGAGLHTYPDMEVVEVVDPLTGAPSDADGDLTLTSAGWHGTALVRYQTGTYVGGVDRDACDACGRSVPRITGPFLPSAWQPRMTRSGGTERVDMRGVGAVLADEPAVGAWRVEVGPATTRSRTHRVLVEVAGRLDDAATDGLARRLEAATGASEVDLRVVADPVVVERRIEEDGSAFSDRT